MAAATPSGLATTCFDHGMNVPSSLTLPSSLSSAAADDTLDESADDDALADVDTDADADADAGATRLVQNDLARDLPSNSVSLLNVFCFLLVF